MRAAHDAQVMPPMTSSITTKAVPRARSVLVIGGGPSGVERTCERVDGGEHDSQGGNVGAEAAHRAACHAPGPVNS